MVPRRQALSPAARTSVVRNRSGWATDASRGDRRPSVGIEPCLEPRRGSDPGGWMRHGIHSAGDARSGARSRFLDRCPRSDDRCPSRCQRRRGRLAPSFRKKARSHSASANSSQNGSTESLRLWVCVIGSRMAGKISVCFEGAPGEVQKLVINSAWRRRPA